METQKIYVCVVTSGRPPAEVACFSSEGAATSYGAGRVALDGNREFLSCSLTSSVHECRLDEWDGHGECNAHRVLLYGSGTFVYEGIKPTLKPPNKETWYYNLQAEGAQGLVEIWSCASMLDALNEALRLRAERMKDTE